MLVLDPTCWYYQNLAILMHRVLLHFEDLWVGLTVSPLAEMHLYQQAICVDARSAWSLLVAAVMRQAVCNQKLLDRNKGGAP